jgi:MFS family permease
MKQFLAIQTLILGLFVLLGNGIRSIGTMSLSVSQSEFASFLDISVEKTDVLVEVLLGGAVIALALAPFAISLRTARRVAVASAFLASAGYAAIGITMHVDPSLDLREIIVIASFALGGFAVAFFAPLAQLSISMLDGERKRAILTTVWTAAQPIAFLIAPQLVRYVAFDIGTGNYFLLLAALPLIFLAIVPFVFDRAQAEEPTVRTAIPWKPVTVFILAILAFEAWTTSNSFVGIESAISLTLMAAFLVISGYMLSQRRKWVPENTDLPRATIFLLAVLFILEIPTTGLYESAYLVRHLCSSDLITTRATLGAASQIAAVFLTGALLARWPSMRHSLLGLSILLLLAGAVATVFYRYQGTDVPLFYMSKMISAAGMGMATTVIVAAAVAASGSNKLVMLAPAFIIMFGTEVGIEVMEIIFQSSKLAGLDETAAYQAVFMAQVVAVALALLLAANRALVHVAGRGKAESVASVG